ncbi:MAG TPA: DUF4386 domain-containing protein [Vicinamibacterales bacterium]|nr:DUF4386 domain-containing protein [Vicinamibacterales bacterium]
MTPAKRVGRTIGVLLLVHLVGGLTLPYIVLNAAIAPGFLASAAAHAFQVRTTVLLLLASGAITLGIAITAWPVFRQYSERLALCFLALAIANFSLQAVESGTVLSMLSLSQEYAGAGADDAAVQTVATAVASARWWAHLTQLITVVSWLFVLYALLWRTAIVPRTLAALGMITTLLQIAGVPLRAFLGYEILVEMGMPLAPVHTALALWLMVKGFDERRTGVAT